MKPLNEKERNEKYYQFISLYFLSVIVIVVAVLFNQFVYKKDYRALKEKLKKYESGLGTPDEIFRLTSVINKDISKIEVKSSDVDNDMSRKDIIDNIALLRKLTSDSTIQSKILFELCMGYTDLLKVKVNQIECAKAQEGSLDNTNKLNAKLIELKAKLDQANGTLRANGLPAVNL